MASSFWFQKNLRFISRVVFLGILFSSGCTGINILNSPVGPEEMNTNPTPAYGRPSLELFYKGGMIYHNESIPVTLTGNAKSIERGEACSKSVLSLLAWGDSSVLTATQRGNIQKIAHIEYEHTAILSILYHSFCTIVSGESNPSPSVGEDARSSNPDSEIILGKKKNRGTSE
ncbi:TRL-like family protein [Leptospira sp. 201903070]|uniref:TRL-like family protein n=1 Tax=Leptospira ainlahdjerensis TaxID=2810033 RepID=A0ABS2U6G8_9LEPT|nr:TRL-like family protein [Leptospira ainlahdjerensis]MBM9575961.1 TRL-like family protein [Leptospira ainlahdjerensis]